MAGGNGILQVLGSPAAAMDNGMTSPQAQLSGAAVQNTTGNSASLGHIQIATVGLLVLSIAVLIGLNKAGFRFSVTVG